MFCLTLWVFSLQWMRDTGPSSSTGFKVSRMMLLGRAHTSLYPGCRSQSSLTAGPVHVMCQSSLVAKVHHAILLQFLSDCCSSFVLYFLCLLCLFFNVYLILSLSASQYVEVSCFSAVLINFGNCLSLFLSDLQNVNITLRILFRPVAAQLPRIFMSIGEDYDERVLPSITTEVLKAVVVSN